jgi:hypothetical protein
MQVHMQKSACDITDTHYNHILYLQLNITWLYLENIDLIGAKIHLNVKSSATCLRGDFVLSP